MYLDQVYQALGYEDANDASTRWEGEDDDVHEDDSDDGGAGYSSASDVPTEDEEGEEEGDGSSIASARATPRVAQARDPMSLSGVGDGGGPAAGDEDDGEPEMNKGKTGGPIEFWGREYSSFTHKKIAFGIRVLTDWDAEQEVVIIPHLHSSSLPFSAVQLFLWLLVFRC